MYTQITLPYLVVFWLHYFCSAYLQWIHNILPHGCNKVSEPGEDLFCSPWLFGCPKLNLCYLYTSWHIECPHRGLRVTGVDAGTNLGAAVDEGTAISYCFEVTVVVAGCTEVVGAGWATGTWELVWAFRDVPEVASGMMLVGLTVCSCGCHWVHQ